MERTFIGLEGESELNAIREAIDYVAAHKDVGLTPKQIIFVLQKIGWMNGAKIYNPGTDGEIMCVVNQAVWGNGEDK